jgi:hypothetical protein
MYAFREQQQFRQPWLWLLFTCISLPIVALLGYGMYVQLVLGRPFGNHPLSDGGLIAVFTGILLLHAAVMALFWFARLAVEVTPAEVSICFRPFHLQPRRIPLDQIEEARARDYDPLMEFGGWGVRMGASGPAYNVSGDHGVQLTLRDGKQILIGSQKAEELAAAIREAKAFGVR